MVHQRVSMITLGALHDHFADVNGHVWEVAFNPFMPLDTDGNFKWEVPHA